MRRMDEEIGRNGERAPCDHHNDMTADDRLDDRAAGMLLSGRVPPGREELAGVAEFVMALRSAVPETVRPSPELEVLLSEGLSPEPTDAPTTAGAAVPGRPAAPVADRARRMRRALQLGVAKLASLGIVAKVGVASAAVAAGTVGAGAAGVLPGPVQEAVADGVAAVTPFRLPSPAGESAESGRGVAGDATDEEPGGVGRGVAEEPPEDVGTADGNERPGRVEQDGSEGRDRTGDEPAGDPSPGEAPTGSHRGDQGQPRADDGAAGDEGRGADGEAATDDGATDERVDAGQTSRDDAGGVGRGAGGGSAGDVGV